MAPKNKTRPQLIAATLRRNYVLYQRLGGNSYRDIAAQAINKFGKDALPKGYDERVACRDVMIELDRLQKMNAELAKQYVQLETERLDTALSGIWNDVINGHLGAIDRFLGIARRRADLLGLDAPKKTDVTSKGETVTGGVHVYLPDNGRGDGESGS